MFDREALIAACRQHDRVVRVVVTRVQGSAPREVGASMLVWASGQSGTIGGGALEFQLAEAARGMLADQWSRHALGPDMGQCCGGAVEVLSEVYDMERALSLPEDIVVRGPGTTPLSVTRLMRDVRNQGIRPTPHMVEGWFVEPVVHPEIQLWIWGAGHVGRALVDVMHPMPGLDISWVDTSVERFPTAVPSSVSVVPAQEPGALVPFVPKDAHHLILTYSHAIDLDLCHLLLAHGFASCGLIGSATKWARFRKRLSEAGHGTEAISRIICPIGDPKLGKHPVQIALGVAHHFALSQVEHVPIGQRITP